MLSICNSIWWLRSKMLLVVTQKTLNKLAIWIPNILYLLLNSWLRTGMPYCGAPNSLILLAANINSCTGCALDCSNYSILKFFLLDRTICLTDFMIWFNIIILFIVLFCLRDNILLWLWLYHHLLNSFFSGTWMKHFFNIFSDTFSWLLSLSTGRACGPFSLLTVITLPSGGSIWWFSRFIIVDALLLMNMTVFLFIYSVLPRWTCFLCKV